MSGTVDSKIKLVIFNYKKREYLPVIYSTHIPRKGEYIDYRNKPHKVVQVSWSFDRNEVFIGVKG